MKIYVANITRHKQRVYVEGIRHVKNGDKFESQVFNTSFPQDYFDSNYKVKTFPVIMDISLVKGKGAIFNEKL